MRIIIEGADLTGKTTAVNTIVEHFNLEKQHVTSKDENTFEFYLKTMLKENIVFDRHFIGEMIYPSIFKRKGNLNKESFKELLNVSKRLGYKIFVFYAAPEVLLDRLRDRGEPHKEVRDNLIHINTLFAELANEYGITIIDTTDTTEEQLADLVIKNIKESE